MKSILFDMDGTIIDPKLGFVRCINHALQENNEAPVLESDLVHYIGPPLDYAFKNILATADDKKIGHCVEKFRDRYLDVGWQENHLYPGIKTVLQTLHRKKYKLAVCTSRRTDLAQKIVNFYEFDGLFAAVYGADSGVKKSSLVAQLLEQQRFSSDSWLIGDRRFDIDAANLNGLSSIAVLWGYGAKQELENCSPSFIISKPEEIPIVIDQYF